MGTWLARPDRRSRPPSEINSPLYNRRVWVLSRHLAGAIPSRGSVLHIGAGDGRIGMALMRLRPDLAVEGADIAPPPHVLIPVKQYEGTTLPVPDKSVDYAVLVDVLAQSMDPVALLGEAARVARQGVVVKDRQREGRLAGPTLRVMDWFGRDGRAGGSRPFPTRRDWQGAFFKSRLQMVTATERLNLYLPPARWLLDRHLHFVAYLTPREV